MVLIRIILVGHEDEIWANLFHNLFDGRDYVDKPMVQLFVEKIVEEDFFDAQELRYVGGIFLGLGNVVWIDFVSENAIGDDGDEDLPLQGLVVLNRAPAPQHLVVGVRRDD